ncbi:glycoside hydrolase family 2 protein [Croceivirga sp. JEA036]|uniref:glycoside hydrolase family 2 protein n=1 Tax=Croceivirga sp. JEA036 TaxID=2721162 RepID=UPI001438B660|nr:glycoside hydrolase family 2 TIM barrel-domain containing protein [Croceivirga sp. JEA036]NJB37774.1 glycoside hydrolase family 2 [Croceivirga sp. JEA036]
MIAFYRVILGFLGLFAFCACKQASVPKQIALNGTWEFSIKKDLSEDSIIADPSQIAWDTLAVPANWDTRERYSAYRGKAYYHRKIKIPRTVQGKQLLLQFDAVYQTAEVWCNGKKLGKHVGGYTPFEFNITDLVQYGEENIIILSADNSYHRGAWWPWGGISRDVRIAIYDAVRLKYQHITTVPNFAKGTINFAVKYALDNYTFSEKNILLQSAITNSEGDTIWKKNTEVALSKKGSVEKEIVFKEALKKYDLWHVNHPYLYQITTSILQEDKRVGELTDHFGIRKIEVKGEQLFLNNEPLYADGFNRVHDHPNYGNTEPEAQVNADMEDIKALGGKFSRLMHAPLAKSVLEFCDKNGYLLLQEIPVWGTDDPQSFPDNPQTKKWLSEMITRDYNHPSVVGWSVGNELRDSVNDWANITLTKAQFGYINSMLDYIVQLDTTRLKTYVSLTSYKEHASLENEPYQKLDLMCLNSYGDAVEAVKRTHQKFPGKPIFVSEIGLKQIGPAPEATLDSALIMQLQELKELPYVVGSALWSYNDYRSDYKGTPTSGFREWGVVSEKREKKKAYKQIQNIYTANK